MRDYLIVYDQNRHIHMNIVFQNLQSQIYHSKDVSQIFVVILMKFFSEQHGIYVMVIKLNIISVYNTASMHIFSFKSILRMIL